MATKNTSTPSRRPPAPTAGRRPSAEEPSKSALLNTGPGDASKTLAALALALRDEQVQAKVVYFGAEHETNEELDAITDAVVADLQAIQAAGARAVEGQRPADVERELAKNLRGFLDKLFSTRRKAFLRRKVEEIQRRISSLFFNSELYSKISAESAPNELEVSWPEQAMFYALKRHEPGLVADLHLLKYTRAGVREEAIGRLQQFEKELRMEFLSRTTPELEKLLAIFRGVLTKFFRQFRQDLGTFCATVVRESRVAEGRAIGYKLDLGSFVQFRKVFDREFLEALVQDVQGPLIEETVAMSSTFRTDTLRFVADPHIFSEICAVMCDACYEYLYGEGFLDVPPDWRARLDRG